MSVVGNQTAVCHIPGFIENLITLLKSQTLLYNSCLFSCKFLVHYVTPIDNSFLTIKTVVERLQKDIPIPGDDSVLAAFENWSRLREIHRRLTTLTQENMSEVSASSVITASRQVCLMSFPVLFWSLHSSLLKRNSRTYFSSCFRYSRDAARSMRRNGVQSLALLTSSHVSSSQQHGTLLLLQMMMFVEFHRCSISSIDVDVFIKTGPTYFQFGNLSQSPAAACPDQLL